MEYIRNSYVCHMMKYGMNILGFDGEVQEVVLSITVVASLVSAHNWIKASICHVLFPCHHNFLSSQQKVSF